MKKIISIVIIIIMMLFVAVTVNAGSIPTDLLDDHSLVFFGEVISVDRKNDSIIILPTQKIKGDVQVGIEQEYSRFSMIYGYRPKVGTTYLMGYYDQINPLYILKVSGTNTQDLKIVGLNDDMWAFFEELLNELAFEKAEAERLVKIGDLSAIPEIEATMIPKAQNKSNTIYYVIILIISLASLCIFVVLRKRKEKIK